MNLNLESFFKKNINFYLLSWYYATIENYNSNQTKNRNINKSFVCIEQKVKQHFINHLLVMCVVWFNIKISTFKLFCSKNVLINNQCCKKKIQFYSKTTSKRLLEIQTTNNSCFIFFF